MPKQKGYVDDFTIYLGTFLENSFHWHKVKSFKNFKQAYKAYKQYVNKQLQYTEDELKKVWDTGRLDIELRRGETKIVNWVGIYSREVSLLTPEDRGEKKSDDKKSDDKQSDDNDK